MTKPDLHKLSRAGILNLCSPRPWDATSVHNSLIIFPTGFKRDSDFSAVTVIGCSLLTNLPDTLIATGSDDLQINGPHRIDCFHKSKAFRLWSNTHNFEVGPSLSSLNINLIPVGAST